MLHCWKGNLELSLASLRADPYSKNPHTPGWTVQYTSISVFFHNLKGVGVLGVAKSPYDDDQIYKMAI